MSIYLKKYIGWVRFWRVGVCYQDIRYHVLSYCQMKGCVRGFRIGKHIYISFINERSSNYSS
jgi:hypothetical protein